jgi:hypothetical protein
MPSTLSIRRIREEDIESYASGSVFPTDSNVSLPNFNRSSQNLAERPVIRHGRTNAPAAIAPRFNAGQQIQVQPARPTLVPSAVPSRQNRRAPLVVRANRALRTVLVAFCGVAILGYGLDVAASNDVGRAQEQSRRLNEQNTELSAQLLRAISFQGIQDNVLGRFGLRVPEQVIIATEVKPPAVPTFKASKHHLPIMSGY